MRQAVTERRQRFITTVDDDHADRGRVDAPELVAQRTCRELAHLTRQFHPGGAAADDHHGQPAPSYVWVGRQLGHLERTEEPAAQFERVIDRLHARRMPSEFVVPEVRLPRARGDDQ